MQRSFNGGMFSSMTLQPAAGVNINGSSKVGNGFEN